MPRWMCRDPELRAALPHIMKLFGEIDEAVFADEMEAAKAIIDATTAALDAAYIARRRNNA